jgi:bifunctional non-homologous end joining protein LigD
MPLAKAPPRKQRFGGPLALSKVHWVRPELVAEITYLSWSDDGLLRHTVFLRRVKIAVDVRDARRCGYPSSLRITENPLIALGLRRHVELPKAAK